MRIRYFFFPGGIVLFFLLACLRAGEAGNLLYFLSWVFDCQSPLCAAFGIFALSLSLPVAVQRPGDRPAHHSGYTVAASERFAFRVQEPIPEKDAEMPMPLQAQQETGRYRPRSRPRGQHPP